MNGLLGFELAYAHLRSGLGRIALSIVAVALGVALVVSMRLMNDAVMAGFIQGIDEMVGRTSLSIWSGNQLPFDENLAMALQEDIREVTKAIPVVSAAVFIDDPNVQSSYNQKGKLVTVQGLDLTDESVVGVYHRTSEQPMIADDVEFLNQRDSILMGSGLARELGLDIGSTIRLMIPNAQRRVQQFTIRGLFTPSGTARLLGGRIIVMDLYAAEAAFTRPGLINRIDLLVVPGKEHAVKEALKSRLPPGLEVHDASVRSDFVPSTVAAFQAMVQGFAFLVCLAGFVVCYSRLATIFEARLWEIALMRAVGLRRSVVFAEALKESLLLGVAGVAIGIPLAILIARKGLPALATATALAAAQPGPPAAVRITPDAIALGVLVGVAASMGAAVVPALRLVRRYPIAGLATRGRDAIETSAIVRWMPPVGLLLIAVGAVLLQRRHQGAILGSIATVAMAFAACFTARDVVRSGGRLVEIVWRSWFGTVGEIAAAHVAQHARRTGMTVATLALSVGMVLMFVFLGWSFEQTIGGRIGERLRAEVFVTSANVSGGWITAPIADSLLGKIAGRRGVASVAGHARRSLEPGGDEYLDGYDRACLKDRHEHLCNVELSRDALRDVLSGKGAIVTVAYSRRYRVGIGDDITIESPSGPRRFKIVATTKTDPGKVVVVSRQTFVELTGDHTVTWIYVGVDPAVPVKSVIDDLTAKWGRRYRVEVRTREDLIAYFAGAAHTAFQTLYVIELIVALLVMVGIGDLLTTAVLERKVIFAMMRAVGLRRLSIFRSLVLEGAAIGIFGIVLGTALGTVLGEFWVRIELPEFLGFDLDVHYPSGLILLVIAATWTLCLGASVIPGIQAARGSVAGNLRNE